MKRQNILEKKSLRLILLRRFLWVSVIMVLAIMSVPFVKSVYDKIVQNDMTSDPISAQSDEIILPELVLIPAGTFEMGEQDTTFIKNLEAGERKYFGVPNKNVEIERPFYISKFEITNEQFDSYVRAQKLSNPAGKNLVILSSARENVGDNLPVVEINWRRAMIYAAWLGEQKQLNCRLPTEAEWEYAARAGLDTAYPWGNEAGHNNANCNTCGSRWDNRQAAPVGQFKANLYGLYDTSGNVWEWTCSAWRDNYDGQEQQCARIEEGGTRAVRGGSWAYDSKYIRSSARGEFDASIRYNGFGFRVMCNYPDK
ncbi:Formylglycine-generating enzyme, required for sulfatase activity, contains SUMF1/FGE domain [Nitrosomonas marina]|uniref:Formylglycine-generating enzyme, required for sulfatase activity, contains SUMF1/FGE domain n=2 Tax=Nitrosomonas marina TaxID=917 RepID=A0A1I0CUR0_9PROT|nr:Formylglycine-generating enzyme, required for sulfatase activity, contains SUMF1/FGE domain [Nitrosomonas marina]